MEESDSLKYFRTAGTEALASQKKTLENPCAFTS